MASKQRVFKGLIKFYNARSDYGFIVIENTHEFYFKKDDFVDHNYIPRVGDLCQFTKALKFRNQNPRATQIVLLKDADNTVVDEKKDVLESKHDNTVNSVVDYLYCLSCDCNVKPIVTLKNNIPYKAYCCVCGREIKRYDRNLAEIERQQKKQDFKLDSLAFMLVMIVGLLFVVATTLVVLYHFTT